MGREKKKVCSKCGINKNVDEFYLEGKRNPKNYIACCKNCINKAHAVYRLNNKEKESLRHKIYYEKNKNKIIKKIDLYRKKRKKNDIPYMLRKKIGSVVSIRLRLNNGSKYGKSVLKYLPYTMQQLKEHLEKQFESWMKWHNYGNYKKGEQHWHIDHIVPQSALPYDSMEHPNFQKAWALENLRPLEAIENIKKSNKIIGEQNEEKSYS